MMKRCLWLILGFVLTASVATATPSVIGVNLQTAIRDAEPNEMLHVAVFMNPEPDGQALQASLQGIQSESRSALVVDLVRQQSEAAQSDMLDVLYSLEQSGDAQSIQPLLMANAVSVTVKASLIDEIARQPNVRAVLHVVEEVVIDDVPGTPSGNELDEIDWGVDHIGAPVVWDMGYTGEGVVVAVMDTGLRLTHLDVQDHLWDGGPDFPNHGWDFYNGDDNPLDDNGHGSMVSGTIASDGSAGSQCGVAPDATLMALKVIGASGASDYTLVWNAMDFALLQGADIVVFCAGWHFLDPTVRSTFRALSEILAAADIILINSAGSYGDNFANYPPPDNVITPGCVPAPWLHPDQPDTGVTAGTVTVGSTDMSDILLYNSSRGPCSWENVPPWFDFLYNGGSDPGLIKPDLTAPGLNIKSISHTADDAYSYTTGTAAAASHVAGVAALLKGADPGLTPAQLDMLMESSAVELGDPGKDNDYGAGRVDALAAVQLLDPEPPVLQIELTPHEYPYIIPATGGTLVFDAVITNSFDSPTLGQVSTLVLLPNGNTYPLNTYNLTFLPNAYLQFNDVTQDVPAMAPAGDYLYVARAGTRPWTPLAQDTFPFTKEAAAATGDITWTSRGWDRHNLVVASNGSGSSPPQESAMTAVYPNPFNPTTTISVTLPETSDVTVSVFNVAGQRVATLADSRIHAGRHTFVFDGTDLASGIYFVSASVPGRLNEVRKVTLLK